MEHLVSHAKDRAQRRKGASWLFAMIALQDGRTGRAQEYLATYLSTDAPSTADENS